ncbi:cytochrome P450 [Scytonema sp. PCC 10023]|uniref:cytochrome P450 n=1 Tax=Scytonema sp. PCC 10023 TaxID=1680591 RepID=UPI0039C6F938
MTFSQQKRVYDLFTEEALLNPYPLYNQIRSLDPVYFSEDGGFWFLTRYKDVEAALNDPRLSSHLKVLHARQLQNLDISIITNFIKLMEHMLIDKDPPEHTRMRKIALQGFTINALESWRSIIQETTDSLLDRVQDKHSMDIVADLSTKLPSVIISKIFDVPEMDRQNFLQWGADIATFWGAPSGQDIEELARKADIGAISFTNLMKQIIAERKRLLGNDMISLLIAAFEQNEMNLEQLPSLCVNILNAGHVTTTDSIPNGLNLLLNHPEQLQKLKETPGLINSAVEEMFRLDPPVPVTFRVAKEDLTIGGKEISSGSVIALGIGAANHDPEKFELPEVFDITRSANEHLSFGKGLHFCLGAVLARMQLTICFNTLLRRMPNISFHPNKVAVPKRTSLAFKGFESFPVKF